MSIPRVLLLTPTPLGKESVGEIFLHDLCLYYPRGNLCCFALPAWSDYATSPDLDWLPIAYHPIPFQSGIQRLGLHFERFSSFPIQQYVKHVQIPALVKQAVQFGEQHRVDTVWAVLYRPPLIYMARKVAVALDVQLVTSVLDPPEYWLTEKFPGLDRLSRCSVLREFGKTLRTAVRCGVMSEAMQKEYETKYGVESVIMRHGIHPNKRKPPAKEPTGEKQFIIGFAGSLYALREWQALLSALSGLNWRIDGRDIIVRLIGYGANLGDGSVRTHIEYLGWRSVEETIDLISEVDVAYLPYWFDESHRLAVKLCFPTKLSTYLASGRPVLFHGPEDSSPARFFRRFPVGLCCHSLEESKIIECLHRFATDRDFYATATAAGQVALEQELDLRVFLRRFATLIGIEEDKLLPI